MIGILIVAHGNLGASLIECATHVVGHVPPQLKQLGLATTDDPIKLIPYAQQLIEELDTGEGVLMLTDMYGATPCNLMAKLLKPGRVEGIAGANLPMIVRALTYRNLPIQEVLQKAMSGGQEGVVYLDAANFVSLYNS